MSELVLAKLSSGVCSKRTLTAGNGAIQITASVGQGGFNRASDVRVIQDALNKVGPSRGGPSPSLAVDGLNGPKTIAAIAGFQRRQCGVKWPDGRVDPGQKTIRRLNEILHGPVGAAAGGTSAEPSSAAGNQTPLVQQMVRLIPRSLQCVLAAEANLMVARTVVNEKDSPPSPMPIFGRQERMRLVNLHFQVDSASHPITAIERVVYIYRRMKTVFQRPGNLWGPMAIAPDPFPNSPGKDGWDAYTWQGGFDLSGQMTSQQQRRDAIYLRPLLADKTDDQFIHLLIHELAHFVGPRAGATIDDFAYGWIDSTRMKLLSPAQRSRNADNYGNFAFHARYGRAPAMAVPGLVISI